MNETLIEDKLPLAFRKRDRPLVLYILGWGRSGSSILANILGSTEGAASLGEVRYLWDRGIIENGICGCGETFQNCVFWPGLQVKGNRLGDLPIERAEALTRSIGSRARPAQIMALHSKHARKRYLERNREDIEMLMGVYEAAFAENGARVIVDASKSPFFAVNFLHENRSFDVEFLHFVRDPRAVLHSWKRTKQREDTSDGSSLFPRYSSTRSLTQWALVNSRCELFADLAAGKYFQVRYENFAENWHKALTEQAGSLFVEAPEAAVSDGRAAHVRVQHSISGNPSRFTLGEVRLKPDTSWNDAVTALDRRLASMICGGVAGRYGYAVR